MTPIPRNGLFSLAEDGGFNENDWRGLLTKETIEASYTATNIS